jgi:hypothetical protein
VKLLYYITSHGYGHALRSSVIAAQLPPDDEVVFRTTVPREFFERELRGRHFEYRPAAFDCGCVQPDGNEIDIPKTLSTYRKIAENNRTILDKEALWCAENGVDVIVSDIVPFAFDVARRAGLPSAAATNFTWHTIYGEYAGPFPDIAGMLGEMRDQYSRADILCEMFPANDMDYFRKRLPVGPVGRVGSDIRKLLHSQYGIPARKKIGLIYTGNFGMAGVAWKRLEEFDDWFFLSLYPLQGAPGNYRYISTKEVRYQDCIASADAMITKLGYGACAECFINGLPIIYPPRTGFAEYAVLEAAVRKWGYGYSLSTEDFCSLTWFGALSEAAGRGKPQPQNADGARVCAGEIAKLV